MTSGYLYNKLPVSVLVLPHDHLADKHGPIWTSVPRCYGQRGLRRGLHGVRTSLRLLPVQGELLSNQLSVWLHDCVVWHLSLCQTACGETLSVPLLNIRQSDLVLRSDSLFLLRQTGLSPDLLLFRDQIDLRALWRAGQLHLTLVDHNVLYRWKHTWFTRVCWMNVMTQTETPVRWMLSLVVGTGNQSGSVGRCWVATPPQETTH